MHPPLVLVILCSLLAQNVQGNEYSQATVTISPEMLQGLIAARLEKQDIRGQLQNLPIENTLRNGMKQQNGGLFPIVSGLVNNLVGNILGLRIRNAELLKLDIRFDEVAKHVFVVVPADLELEIRLPLHLGNLLHLKLYLDVQVGVQLLTNPRDNSMQLVIGNCHNNPGHLRITVFNNRQPLFHAVNNLVGTVTNILEKTVPHLLQKELCPIVNSAIQFVLQLLQGTLSSEVHGRIIQLTPIYYGLQSGAMELDYRGAVHLPGGQTLLIPPGSSPLPQASLDGSSMNILLSSNLMNAALRALVPPQAINIVNPQEVTVFSQAEAVRSLVPPPLLPQRVSLDLYQSKESKDDGKETSSIRTLQIAHGIPTIELAKGSVQAQEAIEIKVFGDHQGRTTQFFTLGAIIHLNVGILAVNGKLTMSFALGRIDNLSVINTSVQNYRVNPKNLMGPITQLVSNSLLPRQNQLLSEGFQLPMAQELGVRSFSVAAGQDTLKLSVPPNTPQIDVHVVA